MCSNPTLRGNRQWLLVQWNSSTPKKALDLFSPTKAEKTCSSISQPWNVPEWEISSRDRRSVMKWRWIAARLLRRTWSRETSRFELHKAACPGSADRMYNRSSRNRRRLLALSLSMNLIGYIRIPWAMFTWPDLLEPQWRVRLEWTAPLGGWRRTSFTDLWTMALPEDKFMYLASCSFDLSREALRVSRFLPSVPPECAGVRSDQGCNAVPRVVPLSFSRFVQRFPNGFL